MYIFLYGNAISRPSQELMQDEINNLVTRFGFISISSCRVRYDLGELCY
jgi:hypothetical protein